MRRRIACLVLAATTLGTACSGGSAEDEPKATLTSALRSMDDLKGVSLVFTLTATPQALQAVAEEDGTQLSEADAQKVLQSSLTLRGRGGNAEDSQFEVVANIAGEDAVEIRMVEEVLYARADVQTVAGTFGIPQRGIDQLAAFGSQQGLSFIRPALAGEWLALQGLGDVAQQLGPSPAGGRPQARALQDLADAVEDEATVTFLGEEEAGDHLRAEASLRRFYERLLASIPRLSGLAGGPVPIPAAADLPDQRLAVDVWVDGDRVTQIELDLLQLANLGGGARPEGADRLALRVEIDDFGGSVEAPAGATPINLQEIVGAFLGATLGTSGTGVPGQPADDQAFPCEMLKGEPRSVLLQFKDECPELLEK